MLFPQIKNSLLNEFNSIMTTSELPYHYRTVKFTIIPKPHKDHSLITIYWPIALINTNLRLFAGIINARLVNFLGKMIGQNQTGFITWPPLLHQHHHIYRSALNSDLSHQRGTPRPNTKLRIKFWFWTFRRPSINFHTSIWKYFSSIWILGKWKKPSWTSSQKH